MMRVAAQKKRKVLVKPNELDGIFDASSVSSPAFNNLSVPATNGENSAYSMDVADSLISYQQECFNESAPSTEEMVHDFVVAAACREKGCALAQQGKMSEAVTKWQEGLLFSPNDHLLHELTAQGFLSLDRNLLALKSAERAVELCPLWTEGLLTLARVQRELGELEASLETYRGVLELDNKNSEATAEMNELTPLLASLAQRREILLQKVEESSSLDETEANTCILNLARRARVG
jgi:tetratricopeptide (TPR) repeat protein